MANLTQFFWQQYILYYSNAKQEQLYISLLTSRKFLHISKYLNRFTDFTGLYPISKAWLHIETAQQRIMRYLQFGAVLLGLIIILILYRIIHSQRQTGPMQQSTIPFMNTLLTRLHGLGWRRKPGQTPAELISEVDSQTGSKYDLQWIV